MWQLSVVCAGVSVFKAWFWSYYSREYSVWVGFRITTIIFKTIYSRLTFLFTEVEINQWTKERWTIYHLKKRWDEYMGWSGSQNIVQGLLLHWSLESSPINTWLIDNLGKHGRETWGDVDMSQNLVNGPTSLNPKPYSLTCGHRESSWRWHSSSGWFRGTVAETLARTVAGWGWNPRSCTWSSASTGSVPG